MIAGSGKLSQGLRFKLEHLSHCLLQFIVKQNTTTLSYLDLLQGDVEDIVVGRGGMMPFALIILWSLKQHMQERISRAGTQPSSVTPCLTFIES